MTRMTLLAALLVGCSSTDISAGEDIDYDTADTFPDSSPRIASFTGGLELAVEAEDENFSLYLVGGPALGAAPCGDLEFTPRVGDDVVHDPTAPRAVRLRVEDDPDVEGLARCLRNGANDKLSIAARGLDSDSFIYRELEERQWGLGTPDLKDKRPVGEVRFLFENVGTRPVGQGQVYSLALKFEVVFAE